MNLCLTRSQQYVYENLPQLDYDTKQELLSLLDRHDIHQEVLLHFSKALTERDEEVQDAISRAEDADGDIEDKNDAIDELESKLRDAMEIIDMAEDSIKKMYLFPENNPSDANALKKLANDINKKSGKINF